MTAQYTPNNKILYVDDEENLLSSFRSLMRNEDAQVTILNDSTKIDAVLEHDGPFAAVMSDQRMPGLDGVGVLERVRRASPDCVRILVTGNSDHHDTTRAVNIGGISHHVSKPWNESDLKNLLRGSVEKYNLIGNNAHLASVITAQNKELRLLLDGTVTQVVKMLSELIGSTSPRGAEQTERLKKFGGAILTLLPPIDEHEHWNIMRSFELFNLGLTMLPVWVHGAIANDGLDAVDRIPAARSHHLLAARMLNDIPRLDGIAEILRLAYKNYDGTGQPVSDVATGKSIPLGSRILHILLDMEKRSTQNFKERDVLRAMLQAPNIYDVEILRLMLGHAQPKQTSHADRSLRVADLREGMLLLQDVGSRSGHILLNANTSLTELGIKMIIEWHAGDPVEEPIRVRQLYQ
jgi:response regulator RpfG family c-di-GMP phosphodiesterase